MILKGKVSIITGAGSGIGRNAALHFAEEGSKIVVVDIVTKTGLETVRMIKEKGGEAIFIKADVTKEDEMNRMVEETIKNFGHIDILFNNAGGWFDQHSVVETSEESWDRVMNVNVKGTFLCSKYTIPKMKEKGGVIINMGSVDGLRGVNEAASYCAAKGAIVNLTRQMALDYGKWNIRVNCICPGAIDARPGMLDWSTAPSQHSLFGRVGKLEEVAELALFLASDKSSYITGTSVLIDGGEWGAGKFIERPSHVSKNK